MTATFNATERLEHGEQCSCKLLAQAIGMDPRALSFEYCHNVLLKRWRLTCHHGETCITPAVSRLGERWRDVGPIDPVKAILMSNDQGEE